MNILLVDIGNSNTDTLSISGVSSPTDLYISSDPDISTFQTQDINKNNPTVNQWFKTYERVIVSSVVPEATKTLLSICEAVTGSKKTCMCLTPENLSDPNGFNYAINLPNISQVGVDRVLAALGAFEINGGPSLVVDAGTALTFCLIDKNRVYQGGNIMPGMKIGSKALNNHTAKIPLIHVKETPSLVGKTTEEAVQIGLYRGYIHAINGFINDYKTQYPNLHVVGTGNGLQVLKNKLNIDSWEPYLIFKGMVTVGKQLYS